MSYTNGLDNPELYFQVKLWEGQASSQGDGTTTAITFDGSENMQPDIIWIKDRDASSWHDLTDATRGVTKSIYPSEYDQEDTVTTAVTAIGSDGFTVGSNDQVNNGGNSFVAWCWKANGAGSADTNGSVNSTKTSANTTSGVSIVDFDLNGESGKETVGHGLGVAPDFIFAKTKYNGGNGIWWVYHKSLTSADYYLDLAADSAQASDTQAWDDAPTSSVFTVGSASGWGTYKAVAYCFAEKQGFSKFGSYKGNGNADGTFIYTGFRPALVIAKRTDSTANWYMMTAKISDSGGGNPLDRPLFANDTQAENDGDNNVDLLSNGFKIRGSGTAQNGSGATYIYMAFAEQPFVNSNGVPCNAR